MYEAKQRTRSPGEKKRACMGGQGYHHVVTEKRVFGQSVFSFYKMYIIHTFFQRFERLFQCKTQFGGSSHCLNLIIYNLVTQLLQKTENKFHRRLSAICCKQIEFTRRHAFLWQSHARILPVEGRMGHILVKSTKNCNFALD